MADTTIKQVLVKFLFDLSDGAKSVEQFLESLESVNAQQQQSQAQSQAQQQSTSANWRELAANIRASIATESAGTDQITASRQNLVGILQSQITAMEQVSGKSDKELSNMRAMTLELERQQSFLKGGSGTTSGTENALGIITKAMQGLGLGGAGEGISALGAAALGGGIGAGIGLMVQQVSELVKEFTELVTESGQLTHVTETFNSLSSAIGAVPVQMLDNLREATGGLVSDMDLMKNANAVLLQGIPLSSAQIVTLTGAVSQLATAQGKDATEAMEVLTRGLASGRTSLVAYYLGLQDTTKEQLKLDQELPESVRYWAQYQTLLEAVEAQNARIGPQQATITEGLTKLTTSFKDFFESLGEQTATSSFGMWLRDTADGLANMVRVLSEGSLADKLKALAFAVVDPQSVVQLARTATSNAPAVSPDAFSQTPGGLQPGFSAAENFAKRQQPAAAPDYDSAKKAADAYYDGIRAKMALQDQQAKESAAFWIQVNEGAYKAGAESFAAYIAQRKSIQDAADEQEIANLEKQKAAQVAKYNADNAEQTANLTNLLSTAKATGAGAGVTGPLQSQLSNIQQGRVAIESEIDKQIDAIRAQENQKDLQDAQAVQENKRQTQLQGLQNQLKDYQTYIAQQTELAKQAFSDGQSTAAQYTVQRVSLLEQELAAYRAEKDAEIALAGDNTKKTNALRQEEAQYASQVYEKISAAQMEAATLATNQLKQQYEETIKYYQDMAAAAAVPGLGRLLGGGSGRGATGLSGSGRGTTDALQQQYEQQSAQYLREFTQELGTLLQVMQQGPAQLDAFTKTLQNVIATMDPNSPQAKAARDILNEAQGVSTSAQGQQGTAVASAQAGVLQALNSGDIGDLSQALQTLQQAIANGASPAQALAKTTQTLIDQYAQAKKALDDISNSLTTFQGVLTGVLSVLGAAFSGIGLKSIGEGFSKGAQVVQTQMGYAQYAQSPASGGNLSVSPEIGMAQSMFGMLTGNGSPTENLQNFGKALASATEDIGTLVNALKGEGGNRAEAGIAGASSGFTLGSSLATGLGTAISSMGGSLSSTIGDSLQALGPEIGAAAGIVTGIISIFSAKAAAQAKEIAEQIQKDFDNILNAYNTSNLTLSQAISQTQAAQQQAISQLSGTKQGQQELNNMLPQTEQAIAQLQAKQQQLFQTMQTSISDITAPTAYQQMISQVQELIQTYDQYLDAGGSVQIANEFLNASYQNLAQQGVQSLNQSYQSAIQDAISYQDLLIQQAQQTAQYLDQVNNILASGAATRTTTEAMTEMTQLSNLSSTYQQQSDQLNEQIQVTGYRLSVEQQIFNLASTRIGLENQLVAAQNAQTAQAMAQIIALQQLVAAVGSGTPITSLGILLSLLGLPAAPTVPGINYPPGSAEAASQGTGGTPTAAAQAMEALVLSLYSQMGTMGLGNFYGEQ